MRKMLLVAIVMLGVAVTADAQRKPAPNPIPKPIQEVTARTMRTNGSITRLKGDVTITIAGAVIAADEATIDTAANVVELSGSVRMTLAPTPAPIAKQ